ncbi:hypothetical protein [Streptomyces sp. NPDC006997]|uniref:hypothetical protein n=1 Tax=Streptomyces sp. NPDC006997 TaxID=3155356 RepID=UPI0033EB4777
MRQKLDASLGIVVSGLVVLIGSRLLTWWPGVIAGAAMILGALALVAVRRRS